MMRRSRPSALSQGSGSETQRSRSSAALRSPSRRSRSPERLRVPCAELRRGVLQLGPSLFDDLRIEQLAQFLLAEQFAQQRAVERQRLGTPFGQRQIALVQVLRGVRELQRARERRRRGSPRPARPARGRPGCRRAVRPVRAGRTRRAGTRGRSRAGLETTRSAGPRPADSARAVAGPTAACASPAGDAAAAARAPRSRGSGWRKAPSARAARRPGLPPLPAAGTRSSSPGGVREPAKRRHDPCRRSTAPAARSRPWRSSRASIAQRPGSMQATAEGRQDAHAPVAQFVAIALHADAAVARQVARDAPLFVQVVEAGCAPPTRRAGIPGAAGPRPRRVRALRSRARTRPTTGPARSAGLAPRPARTAGVPARRAREPRSPGRG